MPLYFKSCPVIKRDKDTSESDDKVEDPIDKLELTLLPAIYCNIWFAVGETILKSLKNELFINVFSHKPAELL